MRKLAGYACWIPAGSYRAIFWVDESARDSYKNWSFRGAI